MSAIDRRLDKLEETYAPPAPPVKWRHHIADSQAEADLFIAEWDAGEAARVAAGLREGLILRVIVSTKAPDSANEGMLQ